MRSVFDAAVAETGRIPAYSAEFGQSRANGGKGGSSPGTPSPGIHWKNQGRAWLGTVKI